MKVSVERDDMASQGMHVQMLLLHCAAAVLETACVSSFGPLLSHSVLETATPSGKRQ